MREPRQRRAVESVEKVIGAALELATEQGIRALTIAALAERSGVSNGSIYHLFGNRETILATAFDRFMSGVEDDLRDLLERAAGVPDPEMALDLVIRGHHDLFASRIPLFRAFMVGGYDDLLLRRRGEENAAGMQDAMESWLVDRFACSPRRAATVFRILFASGAVYVLLGPEAGPRWAPDQTEIRSLLYDALHQSAST